jgi:hypothetical protein
LEPPRTPCSLDRALADEPAAAPERRSRTERGEDATRRRQLWQRIAAGVGVLALVAVAAFFLLGGGDGVLPGDDGPTGFSFDLGRVRAAPIADRTPAQLQGEADEAAEAVKETMDRLYFSTFVDDEAWGAYEDAFALFQGPASGSAQEDLDVLTLGANAATDYESLADPTGTLRVVVLTNDRDVAVSAVARVEFRAEATLTGGGSTTITSAGAYWLRPSDEGWRIFAYRVSRDERQASSPSASAEDSP